MNVSGSQAFRVQLMADEARRRLGDAAVLSSSVAEQSDSAYLLSLLAFEILLKATLHIHDVDRTHGHKYDALFASLPETTRQRLLEAASSRAAREGDFSDLIGLLQAWGRNFVDLRYPYEKYSDLTREEYRARGEAWLAAGAQESQADFVYHPIELNGLTHALQAEVNNWLRAQQQAC